MGTKIDKEELYPLNSVCSFDLVSSDKKCFALGSPLMKSSI